MYRVSLTIIMSLSLLTAGSGLAQGSHHGDGHGLWPDSLETVSVTGTVMIDSTFFHPLYFLDEDGDSNADYHLSFGPWWYQPETGASRPNSGETVTIVGSVLDHMEPPSLVVFEINGLTWREAVGYGMHGWNGDPFWGDQGDTLTVTGVVMVDTIYFYHHYFLDTDNDSIPEYKLGFGPPWYDPESGATRPQDGETVTVFGRVHGLPGTDMLSVYEINDLEWRSLDEPAPWAGSWMHQEHSDTTYAYCVTDSANWIGFPPGHMGGHMGGMFPDSSFVQFWQIHPDSLPGGHDEEHFMGFYLNVHDPFGASMMDGRFGGHHGMMSFQNQQQFRFHYYDEDINQHGLSEDGLMMKYWDDDNQQWIPVSATNVQTDANTVMFTSEDLSNYYVLAAPNSVTGIADSDVPANPSDFVLQQNYPNPFNPVTNIRFELPVQANVKLAVYNLLGQRIALLLNENKPAGAYTVQWDGKDAAGQPVSSGIYLIRLEAGDQVRIGRMVMVK